jgi:hypothetical protein
MKTILFTFLLLLSGNLSAIDFSKTVLKNPKVISSYDVIDLNEDGLKDLAITYQKDDPESPSLLGFYINSDSGFTNFHKLPLSNREVLFDLADILDFPGVELVTLSGKAIRVYRFTDRGYRITDKIPIKNPLLSLPTFRHIHRYKFIHSFSDSEPATLMVPVIDGFELYRTDGKDIKKSNTLAIPGTANYESSQQAVGENINVRINLPNFKIIDENGDKKSDIVFYSNATISIFIRKDKHFSSNPDLISRLLLKDSEGNPVILNNMDREKREWYNLVDITDADNDGILDVFIIKQDTRQSTFDPTSQIQIYYGRKKDGILSFPPTPDQIIVSEGVQFKANLTDLDGDKRLDLAIPTMKMGLFKIISMLVTRSATVNINFYKNTGRFPELPTTVRELDMSFEFSGNFSSPVFNYDGDFNGDGINDLLTSGADEGIGIHYGGKKDFFSEEADEQFEMPLPQRGNNVEVYDFNGDGFADIVYTYDKQDDSEKDPRNLIIVYIQRR